MTSKEALEHLQSLDLDAMENEAVNWGWYYNDKPKAESVREDLAIIKQNLEILEIIKSLMYHRPSFYTDQSQYGQEAIGFEIESDNIWLGKEEREKYKECFKKIKEWLKDETK